MSYLRRRSSLILLLLLLLFGLGVVGYVFIEGWSWGEAAYMTAITLTTVGFGEVRALSGAGRLFTVLLILLGVASLALGINVFAEYLLAPERASQLWRRRQMRVIDKMQDHVIICGSGRVGQSAATSLAEVGHPFVLIEHDPGGARQVMDRGWTVLEGDATRDEVLLRAGVARASGLLVCTGYDADNLLIVLSARTLNPKLFIVARSVDAENEAKMRRVGADKVISPYRAGGRQMANMVLRPQVAEFMEVVTLGNDLALWLEQVKIRPESPLAGQTVVESDVRRRTGAILVALLRGEPERTLALSDTTRFEAGDGLIAVGTREQLAALEGLVKGR